MTPDQLRLLAELDDWQVLGLADNADYWCKYIRDGQGGGTPCDEQWRTAGLWRATYRWGIAMTTHGDYYRERDIRAPEHVVTLTWRQIASWVNQLPDELRAEARRSRRVADPEEKRRVAELLLVASRGAEEELLLW